MTFQAPTFDREKWLSGLSDEVYPRHIRSLPEKTHPETDDDVAKIFYDGHALETPCSAHSCCQDYAELRALGLAVSESFEAVVDRIVTSIYNN